MRGVTDEFLKEQPDAPAFQLTRLMRGVTRKRFNRPAPPCQFQLTRLMRGVTVLLLP